MEERDEGSIFSVSSIDEKPPNAANGDDEEGDEEGSVVFGSEAGRTVDGLATISPNAKEELKEDEEEEEEEEEEEGREDCSSTEARGESVVVVVVDVDGCGFRDISLPKLSCEEREPETVDGRVWDVNEDGDKDKGDETGAVVALDVGIDGSAFGLRDAGLISPKLKEETKEGVEDADVMLPKLI